MNTLVVKRVFLILTKWLPVFGSLLMTIHYGVYSIFNIRTPLPEYVCDASFLSVVYIVSSSILFNFCYIHKLFIAYLTLGSLLVDLHRWVPQMFVYPRVWAAVMFILGIVLLILTTIKTYYKKCGTN